MPEDKPQIDPVVDRKIDAKIDAAKLIPSVDPAASMPPNTTKEDDLRTKGQRDINRIWETTQRNLALFVAVVANLVAAMVVVVGIFFGAEANLVFAAFSLLSSSSFLIYGFYFGRTNHARIGDDPLKRSGGGLDDR